MSMLTPEGLMHHWDRVQSDYWCRGPKKRSPVDGAQTAIVSWLWGCHRPSVLQALVLGHSLQKHKTKADLLLCVDRDTLFSEDMTWTRVLQAYWHIIEVEHMMLPDQLEDTQQERLKGVFSKLQTWTLFADGQRRQKRVIMMDLDMLARRNIDELFQVQQPAAVMRGPTDSCLFEKRPKESFFRQSAEEHEHTGSALAGGINGGLIVLKPNTAVFDQMVKSLESGWHTITKMAEQEFLSYFFGKEEQWNSLHKKFNFQLHHLYLCGGSRPPPGQRRPSSFWALAMDPSQVNVWHFSSNHKPDMVLSQMSADWETLPKSLEAFLQETTAAETNRKAADKAFIKENLQKVIMPCNKLATREWLQGWQEAWPLAVLFVADFGARRILQDRGNGRVTCVCCKAQFFTESAHDVIRDHVLVNCPRLRETIKIPLKDNIDMNMLLHAPCGPSVEKKFNYLGSLMAYYTIWPQLRDRWCHLQLNDESIMETVEEDHVKLTMQRTVRYLAPSPVQELLAEAEATERDRAHTLSAAEQRWKKVWTAMEKLQKTPHHLTASEHHQQFKELLCRGLCVRETMQQTFEDRAVQRTAAKRERCWTDCEPEAVAENCQVPVIDSAGDTDASGRWSGGVVASSSSAHIDKTGSRYVTPQCKKRARTY